MLKWYLLLQNGEMLLGAPGPYNWRGTLFKNKLTESVNDDGEFIWTPVEDQVPPNQGPEPATPYYSYLGLQIICFMLA